jgi:chromosome segregation ATPase
MRRFVVIVLVLIVAIGALAYWRGWFNVTEDGKVGVQVDSAKFKQDKEVFGRAVGEKAKTAKDQVAKLWKKTEGMTGDDKANLEKELAELEKRHNRLEKQLAELGEAGADKYEDIKQDLSKSLAEVEQKTEELTKKLEKAKDK